MDKFTTEQREKLRRAVQESHLALECEQKGQFYQACQAYEKSAFHLNNLISSLPPNDGTVPKLREQALNYTNRANVIKQTKLETTIASDVVQRNIPDNGIGFSYESVFEPVLNQTITSCRIEEPYLEQHHQVQNLVRFCEMLVRRAPSLRIIKVVTKGDAMKVSIDQLAASLKSLNNITLTMELIPNLHDRAVHFNTGTIVKMGRGLHIYKKAEPNTIGFYDLYFRPCHEGKIDIIVPKTE
uniref:MIT domain-containing protein n=1 Tax=Panagrellus redivivus TaxID=6233 RepID=A0A7E4V8Z2_PANRE